MDKVDKINNILGINPEDMPKKNVKYEKRDKGLFERTENSTTLITEDNKFLLND